MSFHVVIEPEARADLAAAFEWYEGQLEGLGLELIASAEATLTLLERSPEIYQILHGEFRRAPIRRFPFAFFYITHEKHVRIVAVFHYRKDPEGWKERISKFLAKK